MPTLQQALEEALVENPDDLATHSAYADYLMEQNDPRGEFIQVQLALEDPVRSPDERARLRARESNLLANYSREWLGDPGRFLVGDWSGEDRPFDYRFARGWLDLVRVLPAPDAFFAALARAPEARLLRRLEVVYDMRYHPFDFDQFLDGVNAALTDEEHANEIYEQANILPPLIQSNHLTNLRVFKLGFSDTGERLGHSTMVDPFGACTVHQLTALLGKCPRLEELYLNTAVAEVSHLFALEKLDNLRVLQYYFGCDYGGNDPEGPYPLSALAHNPSLKRLTTLRLHAGRDATIDLDELDAVLRAPHLPSLVHLQVRMTTFGDQGVRLLLETGALGRLRTLDLGYGNITDEGARLLAASPDLKHLEVLDLSRNALAGQGIATLRATGVHVVAADQHAPDEEDYLFEVDFE
jgi:uncharacterized protein (TIGR02996 family)